MHTWHILIFVLFNKLRIYQSLYNNKKKMKPFEYEEESIVPDEEDSVINEDVMYDELDNWKISDMPSIVFIIETPTTK